jgi:murein L,D-transpeptidase YcbB/YkuD
MASPAPACRKAVSDANQRWPSRRRDSDGIMGDARHQKSKSDHNQGNAFDLSHDPGAGCDGEVIAAAAIKDPRVKYVIWNHRIFNRQRGDTHFRPYHGQNAHTHHCHVSILAASRNDVRPWPWAPGGKVLSAAIDLSDAGQSQTDHTQAGHTQADHTQTGHAQTGHTQAGHAQDAHAGPKPARPTGNKEAPLPADRRAFPGIVLRRGTRGELVTLVQARLVRLKWECRADGLFGEDTERVVRAFQKRRTLEVDGVVGRRTWSALFG